MATDSTVSPLRQRMIEDMAARKLGRHSTEKTRVLSGSRRPDDQAVGHSNRGIDPHLRGGRRTTASRSSTTSWKTDRPLAS